jgi:Ca-activated chloride channel family protein
MMMGRSLLATVMAAALLAGCAGEGFSTAALETDGNLRQEIANRCYGGRLPGSELQAATGTRQFLMPPSPSVAMPAPALSPPTSAGVAAPLPSARVAAPAVALSPAPPPLSPPGRWLPNNTAVDVRAQPVSTFSVDVDTASYALVRRTLAHGRAPDPTLVRTEEMLNYFRYQYATPAAGEAFRVDTRVMPTPWNRDTELLQIGLTGRDIPMADRPPATIILLVDTSGSMMPADRLPLLIQAFHRFIGQLRPQDRIGIVTYASGTCDLLQPTEVRNRARINTAMTFLQSGGSTAGAAGIQTAYAMAEAARTPGGTTRVLLATDGDFNVGVNTPAALERLIADKRKTGIYLSVLGVGLDNLRDEVMQTLAQAGNGTAAYIDSPAEADRVLRAEIAANLAPIADDVKVQVEFNPAFVAQYRLIGYESRMLQREDFNNDAVDAGDVGSSHQVTALYEIRRVAGAVDALRFGTTPGQSELAFVRLAYKPAGAAQSRRIDHPVRASDVAASAAAATPDQRFAAAVAALGQRLRGAPELGGYGLDEIASLARSALGEGASPDWRGFLALVENAKQMRQ